MARRVLMEKAVENTVDHLTVEKHALLFDAPTDSKMLRSLWMLHQIGTPLAAIIKGESAVDHAAIHPKLLAWTLRLLSQPDVDPEISSERSADFIALATKVGSLAHSPQVRRELASLLQTISVSNRKDLATALLQHAEDNGCTIPGSIQTTMVGSKKYLCYDFEGCKAGYPVKVCTFDGAHTPSSVDDGSSAGDDGLKAFAPTLAWKFIAQL